MNLPDSSPDTSGPASFEELASSALAYWEPRRLLYNAILAAIVLWRAVVEWPEVRTQMTVETGLLIFILAILANAFYSMAYLPDVFVQMSRFRSLWLRWRWALWLVGTAFAAALTYLLALTGGHQTD
jgi:hypothetical protein